MEGRQKELTEKKSFDLIATMINKEKNSYYDTGAGAIMWGTVVSFCSLNRNTEKQKQK